MRIKDTPKADRPREKLISRGPQNLKDEELLAILLRTGREGKNALEVAKQILGKYSKKRLLKMTYEDLTKIKGIESAKACTILAAGELIQRALNVRDESLPVVQSVKDVIMQVSYLREKSREHLMAIYLNARNELLYRKHIFTGTIDANLINPREIFEEALKHNATSVIVVHNHPSGDPQPSEGDLITTKQVIEAGKTLDIKVLDHVIIAKSGFYSFKEHKLL